MEEMGLLPNKTMVETMRIIVFPLEFEFA
ncbi:hypothetical protein CCACVL1_06718 [Corchorus capsularis]|uniref:Uncharacterized protein n=1 Tax=Corchorus capsularis TaxID=210143 RepID=A0A1R3JDN7_COCAP|nr:hypothetical protein CCACVL1_29476 [Corchorus capsularis]OMO92941.1 hypothetical protein CCACVL1_06718 [Corchorus capsularis]